MKTLFISIATALAAAFSASGYSLNHPCLLHTAADFEYVGQRLAQEPYASAFAKLKASQYCRTSYTPSPVEYLARLDANNWGQLNWRWENAGIADLWYDGIHNNYTRLMRDAAAAYQLALLYRLENNRNAAEAAKNILVQWAKTNKGLLRNKDGEIIDPNEKLIMFQPYQMAVAAEMLRDYNEWGESADFRLVADWLDEAFYGEAHNHLELQNATGGGHYWMNWDLASMTTILALGVLKDNESYIDEAIGYFKGGGGPGNIEKGVPFLHVDDDSMELLGQGNELGRDQGHNTLCAAVLGTFCQMALAIGEDLFAYDNHRALAFAEYVAKYNLANESLYPDPMQNFTAMSVGEKDSDFQFGHSSFPFSTYAYGDHGTMTEPSQSGRGQVRPGWDYWVGYANSHGLSAIYSSRMAECIRPDGGGGHYSNNSGGFDQIGFSTLMGYRPFDESQADAEASFPCLGDTWIREDSPKAVNGTAEKIELRKVTVKDSRGNESDGFHLGLIGFKFELPQGKKVEKATLRLVTERVKGNQVYIYAYPNNFNEALASWNTESQYAAAPDEAITSFTAAGHKGKSIYDGGISADRRNLNAWTNEIDLTDYFSNLPADCKRVNFLLKQDGDQVCFFSKDNKGQTGAFKDTPSATDFASGELIPKLSVTFADDRSDDDSAALTVTASSGCLKDAEYYSLQGIKVCHPVKGQVYIVKTDGKCLKMSF